MLAMASIKRRVIKLGGGQMLYSSKIIKSESEYNHIKGAGSNKIIVRKNSGCKRLIDVELGVHKRECSRCD